MAAISWLIAVVPVIHEHGVSMLPPLCRQNPGVEMYDMFISLCNFPTQYLWSSSLVWHLFGLCHPGLSHVINVPGHPSTFCSTKPKRFGTLELQLRQHPWPYHSKVPKCTGLVWASPIPTWCTCAYEYTHLAVPTLSVQHAVGNGEPSWNFIMVTVVNAHMPLWFQSSKFF